MVGYGIRYRLDFCDVLGVNKRIDILKRGYTDSVITPFVGSGNPINITYKDNDNKFNQITGTEAIIKIVSSDLINLKTFYSEDEKMWIVKLYSDGFVDDNLSWCGYLIPDKSGEPFQSTFPFQIKASDMLTTLSSVPYANNTALIKKVDSYKNVLIECLNKTGLRLNTVISTDVFESSMNWVSDSDCSLEQAYIDTSRFIDGNNKPYSCFDIITHICNEFTANVSQINGKWHFIDRTMFVKDTFTGVEFTPETGKIGPITINALKYIEPDNIVNADMIIVEEPGYKIVSAYYQYGYLSNKLANGDFNIVNPLPMTQRFPNWHEFGGLILGYGQKKVLTPGGEVLINDYYAILDNSGFDKGFTSDPISVLATNTISVSVFVKRFDSSGSGSDFFRLNMRLTLTSAGKDTYYWSGNSNKWVKAATSSEDTFVQVRVGSNEMINGSSVGFEAGYPIHDGSLALTIFSIEDKDNRARKAIIEDVSIKVDESQYYKTAIGEVTQLTNIGEYSKSPDPVVLLFGDDANKNRTSWMRNLSGAPTVSWFKKGNSNYPATPLKDIVARNILTQYHKPTSRVDGSFRGGFTPLDVMSIPLTNGKYMFLSGTFDVKNATATVVLGEVFTNPFTGFRTDVFLDKGEFKDSKGTTVGSPNGINIPPVTGGVDLDGFIKNQSDLQENAEFHVTGGKFDNFIAIPKEAPSDTEAGSHYVFSSDDYGGGGAPPQVIGSLNDISDVTINNPTSGQSLVYNGVEWVNQIATSAADKNFEFQQPFASETWNIIHYLDKNPSVMVTDSAGTVVTGEIKYNSKNSITLTFNAAFTGTAILN